MDNKILPLQIYVQHSSKQRNDQRSLIRTIRATF